MTKIQVPVATGIILLIVNLKVCLSASVDSNTLRNFLQELSREPHQAGSDRDRELADYVKTNFEQSGFDQVQSDYYNVLLSYPDPSNPNTVKLFDGSGSEMFVSTHKEEAGHSFINLVHYFSFSL